MSHEIKLIPALEGMRELEDESVDLILTDPPYDTLEKWRNMGTTTRLKDSKQSSNEWFPTLTFDELKKVFVESYRVLRKGTDCFVMCDEETGDALKPILRDIGYELRKSLIWWKVGKQVDINCEKCGHHVTHTNKPGVPGMGYPFRSQWEMILHARKGKRPAPENRSIRNVLPMPWIKSGTAYPTEKPVELLEILIKQCSDAGELVVDPFAGSGSCGEAAFNLGREFLGFDVQQEALDYFARRKAHWLCDGKPFEDVAPSGGVFDLF